MISDGLIHRPAVFSDMVSDHTETCIGIARPEARARTRGTQRYPQGRMQEFRMGGSYRNDLRAKRA